MVKTRRWTRSPRGTVFGVVTGLAEWRGLPVDMTRLVVFLIMCCTAFFPGLAIYLALALLLPDQRESDIIHDDGDYDNYHDFFSRRADYRRARRERHYTDATYREANASSFKSDEDLRKEYEELKKKVEAMENDVFDKEKDWDNRFKD